MSGDYLVIHCCLLKSSSVQIPQLKLGYYSIPTWQLISEVKFYLIKDTVKEVGITIIVCFTHPRTHTLVPVYLLLNSFLFQFVD